MAKQAFGAMDANLVNTVNKTNKNYDSEILSAGMTGFAKGAQPTIEKFAKTQKKFDAIMGNFDDASQIPTASAEERQDLQPVVDAQSKIAQDFARTLATDPGNLEAQAGFNNSIQKMNRITESQTTLYKNKAEAKIIYDNNDYSPGQLDGEKTHAMAIMSGEGVTASYNNDSYKTYTLEDGTVYDNDPNTDFPSPPKIEGTFKEGHTTMLKSWNTALDVDGDSNIQKALSNYNIDGSANTLLQEIMTSGTKPNGESGGAPTYGQQMDLLFNDISGDGQDVTYASQWLSGALDQSYYTDDNGDPITNNKGVEFKDLPLDEREAMLRDKVRAPKNMKNLSKFYATSIKDGLKQKEKLSGEQNKTLLMSTDPNSDEYEVFASPKKAEQAKVSLYADLSIKQAIPLDIGSNENSGEKLESMFKNSNLVVEHVGSTETSGKYFITIAPSRGLEGDKLDAQELVFDPDNAADMKEMTKYLKDNANIFEKMEPLGGDPLSWKNSSGQPLINVPIVGNYESAYNNTAPREENAAFLGEHQYQDREKVIKEGNKKDQYQPAYLRGRNNEPENTVVANPNDRANARELVNKNSESNPYSQNFLDNEEAMSITDPTN
jgi:hypothetical protein